MHRQLNLFSNRSSLVLSALLAEPEREWVTRDFISKEISLGQANKTLNRAEELGYVVRVRRGRDSYLKLNSRTVAKKLLAEWGRFYSFSHNNQAILFDQSEKTLQKLNEFLKKRGIQYVLTAFSASRLISPCVVDRSHYIYINIKKTELDDLVRQLQSQLGFLKLAEGGNVRLAVPYYKSSVFSLAKIIQSYPVVPNIHLYLDLFGLPGGLDEIRSVTEFFKKKGERFV